MLFFQLHRILFQYHVGLVISNKKNILILKVSLPVFALDSFFFLVCFCPLLITPLKEGEIFFGDLVGDTIVFCSNLVEAVTDTLVRNYLACFKFIQIKINSKL